ncbi:unnamed protein product, partial [marine sediment metagenome]
IVHIESLRDQNQAIDFLSNYLLKHNPGSFIERLKLFYKKRYFFRYGCFNKGSPKHIFFLHEEIICAKCLIEIQHILVDSEEGKHFGDLDPPEFPKPITRFYAVCPGCDLKINSYDCYHDWNYKLGLCKFCAYKYSAEYKDKIFQEEFTKFCEGKRGDLIQNPIK